MGGVGEYVMDGRAGRGECKEEMHAVMVVFAVPLHGFTLCFSDNQISSFQCSAKLFYNM